MNGCNRRQFVGPKPSKLKSKGCIASTYVNSDIHRQIGIRQTGALCTIYHYGLIAYQSILFSTLNIPTPLPNWDSRVLMVNRRQLCGALHFKHLIVLRSLSSKCTRCKVHLMSSCFQYRKMLYYI